VCVVWCGVVWCGVVVEYGWDRDESGVDNFLTRSNLNPIFTDMGKSFLYPCRYG
jgi:hypothetical protein